MPLISIAIPFASALRRVCSLGLYYPLGYPERRIGSRRAT